MRHNLGHPSVHVQAHSSVGTIKLINIKVRKLLKCPFLGQNRFFLEILKYYSPTITHDKIFLYDFCVL